MISALIEVAASEPVNPARGSGVLVLVLIVAAVIIILPTRRGK